MAALKKYFPLSFRITDLKELLIAIAIYIVADVVCGFVIGLLGKIPLIGFLFSLIGWVAGIYFFVGIVLAVLHHFKLLKE